MTSFKLLRLFFSHTQTKNLHYEKRLTPCQHPQDFFKLVPTCNIKKQGTLDPIFSILKIEEVTYNYKLAIYSKIIKEFP
jgi:hypothetical protein